MNGVMNYVFRDGYQSADDTSGPTGAMVRNMHSNRYPDIRCWWVDGIPAYFNHYPFEIGQSDAALSAPADEQLRFAMSVVSNDADRHIIAAICEYKCRSLAKDILAEYEA